MPPEYLNRIYQDRPELTLLYHNIANLIKTSKADPKIELEVLEDIHLDLLNFVDEIVREEKNQNETNKRID